MRDLSAEVLATSDSLLLSIAEQLKLPLLQIARQLELSSAVGRMEKEEMAHLQSGAETALGLLDSYLLGLQLAQEQMLALEPVSLSALLAESAHQLEGVARPYNVELEVHIAGRYPPVMAHAAGLKAAFLSLGAALIQALPTQMAPHARRPLLRLAVHRAPRGLVTGLYSEQCVVTNKDLQKAYRLCGRARQPFTHLVASSGAGILVADSLLRSMTSRLRAGQYQKLTGLAATLQVSRQLQLV